MYLESHFVNKVRFLSKLQFLALLVSQILVMVVRLDLEIRKLIHDQNTLTFFQIILGMTYIGMNFASDPLQNFSVQPKTFWTGPR